MWNCCTICRYSSTVRLYLCWRNGSCVLFVLDPLKVPFVVLIVRVSFDFQNIWVWNELLWCFSNALQYPLCMAHVTCVDPQTWLLGAQPMVKSMSSKGSRSGKEWPFSCHSPGTCPFLFRLWDIMKSNSAQFLFLFLNWFGILPVEGCSL